MSGTGESGAAGPRTMLDKLWDRHLVRLGDPGPELLYVDLHLIHEVTTPQAFDGLRAAGRRVRRPDLTLATMDHNVPTTSRSLPIADDLSRAQIEALEANCAEFGIPLFGMLSRSRGIVHLIGPEQGVTLPGMTIVCGDSHTGTHGAFGALAFGIGTSEIEHVFATQTIRLSRPRSMAVEFAGALAPGVTAKDLILHVTGLMGVSGGTGHVVEYRGPVVDSLSMEGRMTMCNMSIESGARSGLIAPDATTFDHVRDRPRAPRGERWTEAVADWTSLPSDPGARFDAVLHVDAGAVGPTVTWGTTPGMSVGIDGRIPHPEDTDDPAQTRRALEYMGLRGGEAMTDIGVDRVFIGSCTNGRIEDLRSAADVLRGRRVAAGVQAMVVPGSMPVKEQAEREGLHEVFLAAGFAWREPGCSMCLGMNPDTALPGERCASTSNRNFEGRQGAGSRTHLVSPAVAAAAAVRGRFADPREL